MNTSKENNLIGQTLLFIATVVWGSSFIILKNTIEDLAPIFVISVRFMSCGSILSLIFIRRLRKLSRDSVIRGVMLGLTLCFAYLIQTLGLKQTTPSQNAFITGTYCVMCPFLSWWILKKKPKSYHILSAFLCILGMGLIAFSNSRQEVAKNVILGDILTGVAAVFYALQIIVMEKNTEHKDDKICMLCVELLITGVILSLVSIIFEIPTMPKEKFLITGENLWAILYLTVVCTLMAQAFLIIGESLSESANQSAIILSLEAVFGTLFSVILGDEKLTVALIAGFAVIFIAMLICELKIDVLKPLYKNSKK